jgi:D-methionine transport system ATP-binding protein
MIEVNNLNKNFGKTKVLNDISLYIEKGEIFGVVGHSGAGKSTLLRCLNGLEGYDNGSVKVEGIEVGSMNSKEIRALRRILGMIFQNFNLLNRKNVFDNIALPLEIWKYDKHYIKNKVTELVSLVGLEDKLYSMPSELSGGQKQRVAIARALALEPKILLCDEATSALDPNTTKSILQLLKEINKKLNLTIVVVTHQMEVVKDICSTVALMEDGFIKASGKVQDLFLRPGEELKNLLGEEELLPNEGVNIKIFFPREASQKCIITSMARELDIDFSIVWGKLENFNGSVLGSLVINVSASDEQRIFNYLESKAMNWEVISSAN